LHRSARGTSCWWPMTGSAPSCLAGISHACKEKCIQLQSVLVACGMWHVLLPCLAVYQGRRGAGQLGSWAACTAQQVCLGGQGATAGVFAWPAGPCKHLIPCLKLFEDRVGCYWDFAVQLCGFAVGLSKLLKCCDAGYASNECLS
jgi:hypothetical protein